MALYFFHATNGHELVIDRRGRRVRTESLVEAEALYFAARFREGMPGEDWKGWIVAVYDECGEQVATVPFGPGSAREAAPRRRAYA